MAFRTPSADGLTIPPNAVADANNPAASLQELQQPQNWGRYEFVEDLPNVGIVDGVTVTGTNPTGLPAWANLRPGDTAWVQGDLAAGFDTLYTLGDRGTSGGSNAEWNVASFPPSRYDAAIGKARKTSLIFRETFGSGIGKLLAVVSGAGTACAVVAVSSLLGPCRLSTGTTAVGLAGLYTTTNVIYSTSVDLLDGDTIIRVLTLSTAAEEYDVHAVYVGEAGGNGYSLSYRRTVSANWQLVRWAAGAPTFVTDTGIPVVAGQDYRLRSYYDRAAATTTFFIDAVNVGTVGAIGVIAAGYYMPAIIRKTAGLTAREAYVSFARLYATHITQRPA